MLHRLEETQPQIIIGDACKERAEQGIVLRPYRADEHLAAIGQGNAALPFGGIREDRKTRMATALVQALYRGDGDACIQRDHPVAVGQQRVEIECTYLRDIGGQLRQLDQYQRHRALIGGRHVAVGLEDARHAGASDHFVGKPQVQRRQRQGLVVDHFHRGTPTAEHHHRPEHGVVRDTGDQLTRLGPQQAGLHHHAFDARLRTQSVRALQDGRSRRLHRRQGAQVQAHAIHIGFVRDVGREDLHRYAHALLQQRLGEIHRFVRVARDHHFQRRNAVGLQQDMRGDRVQPLLVVGQRGFHQCTRGNDIHDEIRRQAGRGFHQRRLRLAILHQVLEAAHGFGLAGIGRHACGVERDRGTVVIAQPHREHRLFPQLPRTQSQRVGQCLCGIGRRRERRGDVDHQHRVVGVIGQQRFDGRGISPAIGIDHDVHRVVARPAFRQHLVQLRDGGRRQIRERAAQRLQLVHRQTTHTTTIAENGQTSARERPQASQRFGGGEQLVQCVDAQQAGTIERRAVDRVGSGQCLRMRARAFTIGLGLATGLDHHHRLGTRRGTCGGHELARVADLVDVQQDRAGAVVGSEVIEQVAEIHVQRIAQRHHARETNRTRHAPLHQGGGNRAGFGNQGEVTGLRRVRGDAGVEPRMRRDDAQAVRAQYTHALGSRRCFHLRGE
ncbi:hypothetical protein D3C81_926700 [compost metagenome]